MKTVQPTLRVQLKELKAEKARLEVRVSQAEEERDAAIRDAKRAQVEMDQMFYASSHDLQEPLRSITSYAQILKRRIGADDAEATEFLGYILESANRMGSLVRDMLVLHARSRRQSSNLFPLELVLEGVKLTLQKADCRIGRGDHQRSAAGSKWRSLSSWGNSSSN